MADGSIRRESIENLPRAKRRSRPSSPTDTYFQGPAPSQQESNTSRIVKGLANFADTAVDVSVRAEKNKIELDKVTQQQRALQGLDPTDDATKAGIRAYQVVKMRDQVLEKNSDLAQRIRDNPDMTDEEYEIASRETYADLFSQYQPDAQLSAALSNKVQESQTQLHQIRASAQRKHREWQKEESFKTSIEEYREASQSPQELAAMIDEGGQLANEADALGVSQEKQRTMLLQFAVMDASNGDNRLLGALEGQEWASRDPRMEKARNEYQSWRAQEDAVQIGTEWGNIQTAWKNRTASWGQIASRIEAINERYPGSISAGQVATLRKTAAAKHDKEDNTTQLLGQYLASSNDPDSIPMGLDTSLSSSQRDDMIDKATEVIDKQWDKKIASGTVDQVQAASGRLRDKLKFSRAHQVEVPGIRDMMTNLANSSPNDWEGGGVPARFTPALNLIPMMNDGDLQRYGASQRVRNLANAYKKNRSQQGADRGAWESAWNTISGDQQLSGEERETVLEGAEKAADEAVSRNILETLLPSGREAVPDHVKNYMMREIRDDAMEQIGAGATDYDTVGEASAERVLNQTTILDQGTIVTRGEDFVRKAGTYRDVDGNIISLGQSEVSGAFEQLYKDNEDNMKLESQVGEDLTMDDVIFDMQESGLIQVRDRYGQPLLDGPVPMSRVSQRFKETQASRRAREAQVEREATEAEQARTAREGQSMAESLGGFRGRSNPDEDAAAMARQLSR